MLQRMEITRFSDAMRASETPGEPGRGLSARRACFGQQLEEVSARKAAPRRVHIAGCDSCDDGSYESCEIWMNASLLLREPIARVTRRNPSVTSTVTVPAPHGSASVGTAQTARVSCTMMPYFALMLLGSLAFT